MARRRPIPDYLGGRVFSRTEARAAEVAQMHISALHALASVSGMPHVVTHRPHFVDPREVRTVEGLRISCPERTFLELATQLQAKDLIIAGDQPGTTAAPDPGEPYPTVDDP
ncbi:hypothetical protein [Nesterenkonia muleiensis]|uniref:hypothetical protein n=1 Tax=Nesterenkonia muleiensis TaxID=2282648 RepID=UPI000E727339|nr:hypothetical protein [Nesterenkonia muleiensis]